MCVCVCRVRTWNESSRQNSSARACSSHGCTRQQKGGATGSERGREEACREKRDGGREVGRQARPEGKCHPQAQTSAHRRERGRQLSDFNAVHKSRRPHKHTHAHTHEKRAHARGTWRILRIDSNDLRLSLVHGCKMPAPAIPAFRPRLCAACPAVSLPFLPCLRFLVVSRHRLFNARTKSI